MKSTAGDVGASRALDLQVGEWVEVRSEAEILATLDEQGRLDNLPFMPEMLQSCGRRFKVWRRAHKTCDTVHNTGGRRMDAAVHLEQARCNGQAHGGCDAACLIFWKTAWLKRIDGPASAVSSRPGGANEHRVSADVIRSATRARGSSEWDPTYVCQATMLPQATTLLHWWDLRQYLEDYRSRHVTAREILAGACYVGVHAVVTRLRPYRARAPLIGLYDRWQTLTKGVPFPRKWGRIPSGQRTPSPAPLGLKPGDLVRVKSYAAILETLDVDNRNRGMTFDAELVPYCGKTFRVRSIVSKIIDEKTGKMLHFKSPSFILEGVWCKAHYSDRRMFCPRAIYSFWREAWLERVDGCAGRAGAATAVCGGQPESPLAAG